MKHILPNHWAVASNLTADTDKAAYTLQRLYVFWVSTHVPSMSVHSVSVSGQYAGQFVEPDELESLEESLQSSSYT